MCVELCPLSPLACACGSKLIVRKVEIFLKIASFSSFTGLHNFNDYFHCFHFLSKSEFKPLFWLGLVPLEKPVKLPSTYKLNCSNFGLNFSEHRFEFQSKHNFRVSKCPYFKRLLRIYIGCAKSSHSTICLNNNVSRFAKKLLVWIRCLVLHFWQFCCKMDQWVYHCEGFSTYWRLFNIYCYFHSWPENFKDDGLSKLKFCFKNDKDCIKNNKWLLLSFFQ